MIIINYLDFLIPVNDVLTSSNRLSKSSQLLLIIATIVVNNFFMIFLKNHNETLEHALLKVSLKAW